MDGQLVNITEIFSTILYTGVGLALMVLCWWVVEMITPFSLKKEIESEQNIAIAILMAAIFIAISIVIAAVILS